MTLDLTGGTTTRHPPLLAARSRPHWVKAIVGSRFGHARAQTMAGCTHLTAEPVRIADAVAQTLRGLPGPANLQAAYLLGGAVTKPNDPHGRQLLACLPPHQLE